MTENQTENNTQQQPAITINAQFVKDISFEAPHVPQIFTELKTNPEIAVSVDVQASKLQDALFQVALKIKAEAKVEDKVALKSNTAVWRRSTFPPNTSNRFC
mgnify:CR=1 FL=1